MNTPYSRTKLGILGGGQLGRMLIREAIDADLFIHCLDPASHAPAQPFAHHFVQGDYADYDTVWAFGQEVDKLTIEIEKVNADALKALQDAGKTVYPDPSVIEIIQDKGAQKQFFAKHYIPTAPFFLAENLQEVKDKAQFPVVQKLRRDGYDGRGVAVLKNQDALSHGFDAPAVVEEKVDIHRELAVQISRNRRGETAIFPVCGMTFHPEANLLEYLYAPVELSPAQQNQIDEIAFTIAHKLDLNGILAIELFEDTAGRLRVNELAPRPHNSGHHTMQACYTSQYGQLIRMVLDMPPGDPTMHHAAVMVNLLGEEGHEGTVQVEGYRKIMALPHVYVNLYGKRLTRPFRKMGHVTVLGHNIHEALQKAEYIKQHLKITAQ